MRILRAAVVGALGLGAAGPALAFCEAGEAAVFSCSIASNGNRVSVCRAGMSLGYAYGPAKGSPELELPGDVYTDFRPWLDGDALREDVFRFRNGDYRYEVISGLTASNGGDVAYGRVDVYQGADQIASLDCHQPSLFTQSVELYEELNGAALCWNDGLDRWAECPEAEPEIAEGSGKPPPPSAAAPAPVPAQSAAAGTQTFDTVTGSRWTLFDSPSCGIGGQDTDYQRFLPGEYYNVISGNEYRSDDMRVEYFRVDEAARSFEASYSSFIGMMPGRPWTTTEYVGTLQDDGSLELVTLIHQIDTDTMSDLVPRYDTTREEHVLWPCDDLPEVTAGSDNATRVIVQVPDGLNPDDYDGCDAVFDAAFAGVDSPIMTVFEQVDGVWYGENFHTAKCEETMPNMCPALGGAWTHSPREVSSEPLVLESTMDGCTTRREYDFSGRGGVVNVTSSGDCAYGDPFSHAVIDCAR